MIYLDQTSGQPLYQQLYYQLSAKILSGTYPTGTKLPSSRSLAVELGVGRNTVNRAYQQLLAEGYLNSQMGSGFYVNPLDPDLTAKLPPVPKAPVPTVLAYRYHFFYGTISSKVFPHAAWRKSVLGALTRMECSNYIGYPDRQGEEALRQSIAAYLRTSRNVECEPRQIIITSGHQQSMEILARMFQNSPRRFAIEEPGYDGIRVVFEHNGYQVIPVPVEQDGIQLNQLEKVDAELLYLTPSHQFPTGCLTPIPKRLSILNWARSKKCYIIEDDYDSELRYSYTPVPSMQSLDSSGQVIYAGTFSKCLSPTLRTAYLVLPQGLLPRYYECYQRYNTQVSPIIQCALADFLDSGAFLKHISRMRTYYRRQQAAFIKALYHIFGQDILVYGQGAGLHVLVDFKLNADAEDLIRSAARAGIGLYSPIANYIEAENCPRSMLLLGFANLSAETNEKALRLLRDQWKRDGLI